MLEDHKYDDFSAEDAYILATNVSRENEQKEYNALCEEIYHAAELGKYDITLNGSLSKAVEEKIKKLGYEVKTHFLEMKMKHLYLGKEAVVLRNARSINNISVYNYCCLSNYGPDLVYN